MQTHQSAVYGRDTLESLDGNPESTGFPTRVRYIVVLRQRIPKAVRLYFLLFIATIPFESISLMSGSLSPARIFGLLFFASCLLSRKRCFARPPSALWWLLGNLIIFVAFGGSGSFLITRIQLIFLLWVATNLFKEEKLARNALLAYAIAVVIFVLCTVLQLPGFSDTWQSREFMGATRAAALGYNPNELSGMIALGMVILIGFQLEEHRWRLWQKVLCLISTLLSLGVLVRTGSRAGIGMLVIGVSMYLLALGRSRRKMTTIAVAVCILIAIGYMVVINPLAAARWGEAYYEGDTSGRDRIFSAALEMIVERPILGWGPTFGGELGHRIRRLGGPRDAHNLIFHLFLEVGALGAVPFLVGLGICTRAAWKGRMGKLGILPFALLITTLASNLAGTGLTKKQMWLVLALALATASTEERQGKRFVQSNL